MYIYNRPTSEYAASVTEGILNYNITKENTAEDMNRVYCVPIGRKTWPEVIRLYKESKSKAV
jgi:hypothetical protein